MNNKKIREGNKLIAIFMGLKFMGVDIHGFSGDVYSLYDSRYESNYLCCCNPESMEYHSSWHWLMPVIEKIESITMGTIIPVFEVVIGHKRCIIESHPQWDYHGELYSDITIRGDSKIKSTWLAIIEFIKWYNKQKS